MLTTIAWLTLRRIFLLTAMLALSTGGALAQATSFTYQRRLTDGGTPANGNYDLQFALFDSAAGGTQIGSTQTVNTVAVNTGVFAVTIDFGAGGFSGANRFLEISARLSGAGSFTLLTPRQPITSTPYAVRSSSATNADTATNATNATNAAQLGGVAASQYVQTNDSRLSNPRPPTASSSNYIQNTTSLQGSSNFSISGNGMVGGNLTANGVGIGPLPTSTPAYPLSVAGSAGSGPSQGVVEFSNGAPDTGFRINNTTGSGRTWTLFSSGTGSGIGAGNFSIYDVNASQPRISVDQNGRVGIGTTVPAAKFHVASGSICSGPYCGELDGRIIAGGASGEITFLDRGATSFGGARWAWYSTQGVARLWSGGDIVTVSSGGVDGAHLDVHGFLRADSDLAFRPSLAGGNALRFVPVDPLGIEISTCASSLRYKKDVARFTGGLDIINRLSPISFTWKAYPERDLGLAAEDVAAVEPRLVTHNAKRQIEGVKYDRLTAVLVNAIKQQQEQIRQQHDLVKQQQNQIKFTQSSVQFLKTANARLSTRLRAVEKRLAKKASSRRQHS